MKGGLEIIGVPGIGYVALLAAEGHHEAHFASAFILLRLCQSAAVYYAVQPAHVAPVHADYHVKAQAVLPRDLPGRAVRVEPYAMLSEALAGWRVYAVAYFLGRNSHGFHVNLVGQTFCPGKCQKYEFGHRTAADVAVAQEQYACHALSGFGIMLLPMPQS